jgi:hypothetical protein
MRQLNIRIDRIAKKSTYTIGKLYLNGVYFCDTLEDTDRELTQGMPLQKIKDLKIKGATAIPKGKYKVTMNVVSPKFSKRATYQFCQGKLPRLLNVDGYEGVLIHIGNTAKDTEGCILVGQNKVVGQVINSTVTFKKLYAEMLKYQTIILTIR